MVETRQIIIDVPSMKKSLTLSISLDTTIDEVLDKVITHFQGNLDEKSKEFIKKNLILQRVKPKQCK